MKGKNCKLNLKIKNFCFVKGIVKKMKSKLQDWEKIFTNGVSARGFVF